jgi:hypothetical protein
VLVVSCCCRLPPAARPAGAADRYTGARLHHSAHTHPEHWPAARRVRRYCRCFSVTAYAAAVVKSAGALHTAQSAGGSVNRGARGCRRQETTNHLMLRVKELLLGAAVNAAYQQLLHIYNAHPFFCVLLHPRLLGARAAQRVCAGCNRITQQSWCKHQRERADCRRCSVTRAVHARRPVVVQCTHYFILSSTHSR